MSKGKRKLPKKYSGAGYIQSNFPAPRILFKYLWSLTEDIGLKGKPKEVREEREMYHRFIAHIYVNMRTQVRDLDTFQGRNGYVPIYSRLIECEFGREFDKMKLRDADIIESNMPNQLTGKSREFRLTDKIFNTAMKIEFDSLYKCSDNLLCKKKKAKKAYDLVNLMTGRLHKQRQRSEFSKKGGNIDYANLPKLIKKSIKSLKPCPFNPQYIHGWVEKLRKKYKYERIKFKKIKKQFAEGSDEYGAAEKDYRRAFGRYLNDQLSLQTILSQKPKKLKNRKSTDGGPLYKYKAAYSIQSSGRISEINGGFQNACQYFKHKFCRHVPNIYNYDLKNSQAAILIEELEKCGFPCPWLKKYVENPDMKKELAKEIGIPVDLWKDCFYALVFGAVADSRHGTIYNELEDHFEGDLKKTEKAFRSFTKVLSELTKVTEEWRDYVYESKDRRYYYQHGDFIYWKNACGMHFKDYGIRKTKEGNIQLYDKLGNDERIESKRGINKCKRRLAAFILQGQEACFIHNLTIVCSGNNIPVYKNEHDGIITGKKIPQELIGEAAKKANIRSPEMKIKKFCSKEKRAWWKRYVEVKDVAK